MRFPFAACAARREQKSLSRRSNTASGKRYEDQENERKSGHTANTLSPRILLSGKGRQEPRVDQLSAPTLTGAPTENVAALSDAPLALFLDVDGTLIDLALRPEDVMTPADLVATLATTERKLAGALALISGRTIEDLDHLFEPLRLRASGIHGAEIRLEPGDPATPAPAAVELPQSLWTALTREVASFPGAFVENKRFSFVVHYRLAPAAELPLRQVVARLVGASPIAIEVMDARCAIELKPPGHSKGRAIAAFLSQPPFRGRKPIFVGDDATDESGFAVVSARGGYAYSVGKRRPGAIGHFAGPREVRDWLGEFARRECGA
jgi:trehalose 6-phosphate phosphatase